MTTPTHLGDTLAGETARRRTFAEQPAVAPWVCATEFSGGDDQYHPPRSGRQVGERPPVTGVDAVGPVATDWTWGRWGRRVDGDGDQLGGGVEVTAVTIRPRIGGRRSTGDMTGVLDRKTGHSNRHPSPSLRESPDSVLITSPEQHAAVHQRRQRAGARLPGDVGHSAGVVDQVFEVVVGGVPQVDRLAADGGQ